MGTVATKFLRPKEVEAVYGIKAKTLEKWRWLKCGPPFRKLGSAVFYAVEELERWIDERTG